MKIMAEELKKDYGKTQVSFSVSADVKCSNLCFFTLNKKLKNGQFTPVAKSECKRKVNGLHQWIMTISDTDTLADGKYE